MDRSKIAREILAEIAVVHRRLQELEDRALGLLPLETLAMRGSLLAIRDLVGDFYGIPLEHLVGKRRDREITRPRMMGMALSRTLTAASYSFVGRVYNRDHTTVLHAIRRIEKLRGSDSNIAADWSALSDMFEGSRT